MEVRLDVALDVGLEVRLDVRRPTEGGIKRWLPRQRVVKSPAVES